MNTSPFKMASIVVACLAFATAADTASAWTYLGKINGFDIYRDDNTQLMWTVTLGQVRSSDNGVTARQQVANLGFRLPSFQELQVMYNFDGGGQVLGIRANLLDYYETNNPVILGNASINGFQTPQHRLGIGNNWYIGVR